MVATAAALRELEVGDRATVRYDLAAPDTPPLRTALDPGCRRGRVAYRPVRGRRRISDDAGVGQNRGMSGREEMEPPRGIEPLTYSLRVNRSTD